MEYFVKFVDRGYCVERCHGIGVCFRTEIGYQCLCDDGSVGGDRGGVVEVTFDTPAMDLLSYWPYFLALWLLIIVIGLVELMCIWWRRRAARVVEIVPNGEVAMLDLERGVGGDLEDLQLAEELPCVPLEEPSLGGVESSVVVEGSE